MKAQKQILYKVESCHHSNIVLQVLNKAALFNITWHEFFMPDYLWHIPKPQIFYLGVYYTQNMQHIDLKLKLCKDSEVVEMNKMILSEIRGGTYLMLDIKTNKLETISSKFIVDHLDLLKDFTSLQCYFLGVRAGSFTSSPL